MQHPSLAGTINQAATDMEATGDILTIRLPMKADLCFKGAVQP
jgi:hypothetical protein